ncbi:MAG: NAD-dependent epimerase/dehydratase family protein [Pseudomonadota bacterium]
MPNTVLLTGSAGFIGAHTASALLSRGESVLGVDNFNPYYDVGLKRARLQALTGEHANAHLYRHIDLDLADTAAVADLFARERPGSVIHLAAQAGVRHSLTAPHDYISANLSAFLNILEGARAHPVSHLVFASTSSVYGGNRQMPYSVTHGADHPVSLYAATKRSNELMAHTYSHLFQIPTTGLRFFTVYGPWGRPDMSPFLFTRRILNGETIDVFNEGHHKRDFTYVDDIVEGVLRVHDRPATADASFSALAPKPNTADAPYRLYNIGSNRPVGLLDYIETIERVIGKPAHKNLLPMQPGDVEDTYADVSELVNEFGYQPSTRLEDGIRAFVRWYRSYYDQ